MRTLSLAAFIRLVCVAMLLAISGPALAASVTGRIVGLIVAESGDFYLFRVDSYASGPACNTTARYAASLTPPNAKAQLASIMLAYALGSVVTVVGTGDCSVYGNAETASYVCVGSIPC